MSCHFLSQGIFRTQGWNPGLLHCRWILYRLSHQGSPRILEWVADPISRGSSQPGNRTGFCWLQVDSLPDEQTVISSVPQSCLTLCDPMDCSTPGFPIYHQLLELAQTHVHRVSDANPSISSSVVPFSSCLQSFPALGFFPMSQFFASRGQIIAVSALTSVLPMNIEDWFPLEWTGWISLKSEGLSRVFSNTTVQKHQFFGAQPSSQSNSHIHTWPQEKP